jgi:hypothetical protein
MEECCINGSYAMISEYMPQLIATAGPIRIEKVSGGYQLWNDYRFIAFFIDLQEATNRMHGASGLRPCSRSQQARERR